MSASRSRFYVDTPLGNDPPSQRHSMYVSHSEMDSCVKKQDVSSASSSTTLPSTAGSVDRLTGLGNEKKTPRFFTLKPKTSFSLRPFFSSSSIPSLSPSKRRRKPGGPEITLRQDSYVQTDDNPRAYDEVGVQTLNASTVDVPVQTCSSEWDVGDTYIHRKSFASKPTFYRSPYGSYSSRWSPSAASKPPGLLSEDSSGAKNSIVAPLDSSKLLKYASPHDSAGSSETLPIKILKETKASDRVPLKNCLQSSSNELENPINVQDSVSSCVQSDASASSSPNKSYKDLPYKQQEIKFSDNIEKSEEVETIKIVKDSKEEVNLKSDIKIIPYLSSDSPTSVLKVDRTDSPKSNKTKSVHFQLSDSIPNKHLIENKSDVIQPRNIDKEFEALLRNLDILPDEHIDIDVKIPVTTSVSQQVPKPSYISPDLKSALDALKQDFLAPIPENDFNSDGSSERNSGEYSTNINDSFPSKIEKIKEEDREVNTTGDATNVNPISKLTPTCTEKLEDKLLVQKQEFSDSTSFNPFESAKLDLDVRTDDKSENVYPYENTVEPANTVFLPTLPSCFECLPHCTDLNSNETFNSRLESPLVASKGLLDENKEDMLSRSSSRSSMRSNSILDYEACLERTSKFDSCENLDQLEEEIIRSLYSPDEDPLENENNYFPNTVIQNSDLPANDAVPCMRRMILDRLLGGESVDEIMPSGSNSIGLEGEFIDPSNIHKKIKRGKKYTATLSKFDDSHVKNTPDTSISDQQYTIHSPSQLNSHNNHSKCLTTDSFPGKDGKSFEALTSKITVANYPKPSSLFLLPDNNHQNSSVTSTVIKQISSNACTNSDIKDDSTFSTNIQNYNNTEITPNNQHLNKCDSSSCIRPSQIQNSPFFAEISSRSPLPRYPPDVSGTHDAKSSHKILSDESNVAKTNPTKQNGLCDFANCLKPSQVQNSIFTAELSEITANRPSANQDSSRTNSPVVAQISYPSPSKLYKSNSLETATVKEEIESDDCSKDPIQHRTELTIVLQPSSTTKTTVQNIGEKPDNPEQLALNRTSIPNEKVVLSSDIEVSNPGVKQSSNSTLLENTLPPPPPPPLPTKENMPSWKNYQNSGALEVQLQSYQTNLSKTAAHSPEIKLPPKTSVVVELEERFRKSSPTIHEMQNQELPLDSNIDSSDLDINEDKRLNNSETFRVHSPLNSSIYKADSNGFGPDVRIKSPTLVNGQNEEQNQNGSSYPPKTVISNDPPPSGAVFINEKVTVDGDKVHTDKYYALPVKEVLKETTTTTKFIPAPPKYEGIGPTEDGIPTGLRNSVKKENMHNWYKTMFKSLHKTDSSNDPQEYIIGYSSEPESSKKEKIFKKKSATLDSRSNNNNDIKLCNNNITQGYPPSAKSSIEIYNVRPRLIEDYEPGQSSVTDDEITIGSKRYLPAMNVPKPSYEFKNGYEQDNLFTKKLEQPDPPSIEQQKVWYKEIQHGGDVPQYGLAKPAPEKPKEPSIGPLPQPPLIYNGPSISQQGIRPSTLPSEYAFINENGTCQQMNGAYEIQMRHAIHSELHQRLSPSSSQVSSPTRSILKSPCKTPDLKIPARALFDFKAESPKEIPLKKDDNVLILRQLDKNWYEGEKQGIIGIFPISYIEIVPPEHASLPQSSFEGMAKVLYDFNAHAPIELSVKKYDTITLLRRVDSNWYEAQLQNKKGIVPVSYLQVLQEPTDRRTPLSSPNSYLSSSGSRPNSREGILKTATTSSLCSPNSTNSSSITNGRNKFHNRGKKSSNLIEPVMYRAMYSYAPQNSDELELAEGDTIYVVEMCDDGWYVGTSVRTGVFGIFPGNYVEKV